MMHWLTDRERIAKGLECCTEASLNGKCPEKCPFRGHIDCRAQLMEEALGIVSTAGIEWTPMHRGQPEEGKIVLVAVRNKERTIAYVEEAAIIDGQWIPAFDTYDYPHDGFRPYAWTTDIEPPFIKHTRTGKDIS